MERSKTSSESKTEDFRTSAQFQAKRSPRSTSQEQSATKTTEKVKPAPKAYPDLKSTSDPENPRSRQPEFKVPIGSMATARRNMIAKKKLTKAEPIRSMSPLRCIQTDFWKSKKAKPTKNEHKVETILEAFGVPKSINMTPIVFPIESPKPSVEVTEEPIFIRSIFEFIEKRNREEVLEPPVRKSRFDEKVDKNGVADPKESDKRWELQFGTFPAPELVEPELSMNDGR